MAVGAGQRDPADPAEHALPQRVTVIAEHLDPRRDLAVVGGITLIQSLVALGIGVRVVAGSCPAWALPAGAELHQLGGPPARLHRLIHWHRWCTAHAASAEHGPVLSLSPMVRGDVNLLLAGTQRSRILQEATPRDGGAIARVQCVLSMARPRNLLRLVYERGVMKHEQAVVGATAFDPRDARYDAVARAALLPLAVPAAPPEISAAAEHRAKLCQGLHIPPDAPLILFPSTRPRIDGFGPMMLALRLMREQGSTAVALLAGRYRYTHLSWIAELGLRDAVRFVGPTRRLGLLSCVCDAVVHPTLGDPSGQAVLLAIAAGKPVVTTPACAAAGLFDQAVAPTQGAIVEPGCTPEALTSALQRALAPSGEADWAAISGPIAAEWPAQAQARAVLGLLVAAKSQSPLASGGESD